ncbi:hypothetical protein WG66_002574 [Moniliophthora roreri]|nr:hypothetical protein WG66_002574 [Moniliophthora roreri]
MYKQLHDWRTFQREIELEKLREEIVGRALGTNATMSIAPKPYTVRWSSSWNRSLTKANAQRSSLAVQLAPAFEWKKIKLIILKVVHGERRDSGQVVFSDRRCRSL